MIPFFFEALKHSREYVREFVNDRISLYARLPKVPEQKIEEGDGVITILEDGATQHVELRTMSASSSKSQVPFAVVDPAEIYRMLDELAFEMALQQQQLFKEKIGAAAEVAGNVFSSGRELTPEDIFRIFQKITLGFFDDGTPHELEMVAHPRMVEEYRQVMASIKADPELNRQFQLIITNKRQEWHARENLRKLVG